MTVEQPAFGGRRHIGELVPVTRPVAVFFSQCRESGEVAHGDALLRGRHRRLSRCLRPERLSRWRRPHPARCARPGFRRPAFLWQRRHRCLERPFQH